MIFRRTVISILVAAVGQTYASTTIMGKNSSQVDDGSNWLTANNGINKVTVGANGDGNSLINSGALIPQDSNGNNITENNVINITDTNGLTIDNVYGGYCLEGNASCGVNNTAVVINDGTIGDSAFGASSTSSSTASSTPTELNTSNALSYTNTATGSAYLNNGSVGNNMYGAYTSSNASAEVTGNTGSTYTATNSSSYTNNTTGTSYLNGGSIGNSIYGAYADSTAIAQANTQVYAKGTANNSASFSNNVTGNVYLNGGSVGSSAYGAYSSSSAIADSSMNVSFNEPASTNNTSTFNNQVSGNVSLAGGTINGSVYGAASNDISTVTIKANMSNQTNNGLAISNDANITSNVTGNVNINGGTVTGNIYGAHSSVTATTNVTATTPSDFDNNITHTTTFNITNQGNVSLSGNVNLGSNTEIWGGYLDSTMLPYTHVFYEVFKGNTFNMSSNPITVSKIGNFEYYNFNLNDNNKTAIANNQALVTVTDTMKNDNTVANNGAGSTSAHANLSTIAITGISGTGIVKKGDSITLVDASSASFDGGLNNGNIGGLFNTQTGDTTKDIKVGLVGKADVSYTVDTTNNKILATVDDISVSKADVMANVKPLAEGRLAALQNTTRGADLLLDVMGKNKPVGTFTPIFVIDGGLYKYNSGSHIRTRDYRTMLGTRYQFLDNFYAGIALEYGRSNYDTYNKFNSVNVNGNGHTYNYGASIFGKYTYNLNIGELYTDAAFRFGRTRTEFKSHDIITGSGSSAKYKSDANYVGGFVGTGFIYSLNNTSSFDTSAHYFYDQLRSDSVVIDGDKVNFKRATSSRAQLKEQYNYKLNHQATLYLGGMYEYEFDSKAHANTAGISIDAPSVKGSTGGLELGVKATPFVSNKDLTVNMGVKGYVGKRKGGSLLLSVNYDF